MFKIGSYLAQTEKKRDQNKDFLILDSEIQGLENIIDEIEKETPPITRFVLPGGTIISSQFQIARTICRRAERKITFYNEKEKLDHNLLIYINRLSDFLFVTGRFLLNKSKSKELFWEK